MNLDYPEFTLASYEHLLEHLCARWQVLRLCDAMTAPFQPQTLILRHDVDLWPALALPMAEIERAVGISSTYFVALHLYYNPHLPLLADVIRRLALMGHEIGLHYDADLYAEASLEQNLELLDRHVRILQEICGVPVRSIARHNPSLAGQGDPFQESQKYYNAYEARLFRDTVYISDSCGAWRADGLRSCWREPRPQRVYLLTHPEQWGETTDADRMGHFAIMRARVMREHDAFFDHVRSVWRHHAGGKEHDERLRQRKQAG